MWQRLLLRLARALVVAWLCLCILAALLYPRLLYHPNRDAPWPTPEVFGVGYEEFWLEAPDGTRLNGWFLPGAGEGPKTPLLVFHGNAGNLATAVHRLALLSRLGRDVYMIDYHGYGLSGGKPGEDNLYMDAETAWRHLVESRGAKPSEIVVMGYSLGGAVAAKLASDHPDAAGLILESTFTRLSDVADDLFPFLPCKLILGNAFNTYSRLPALSMPLLVIHGRGDGLVPYKLGVKIHDSYRGRKRFMIIGDDHNLGYLAAGNVYEQGMQAFLDSLAKEPPRP